MIIVVDGRIRVKGKNWLPEVVITSHITHAYPESYVRGGSSLRLFF